MKKIFISLVGIAALSVFSGEREDLIKQFVREYSVAEKTLTEKAETTLELVSAAGNTSHVAGKHLDLAFDYKLRNTPDAAERLKIIETFKAVIEENLTIHQTPREGMGSLAGMSIYSAAAALMRQQTAVWLLDAEAEKRWKRLANVPWMFDGKTVTLSNGKAKFKAVRYDEKVTLELLLFPASTFSYKGRDFAIIRTDIPFSVCDDYSEVYLCELKNGKLSTRIKFKMPFFSKIELKGSRLLLFGHDNRKEEFSL